MKTHTDSQLERPTQATLASERTTDIERTVKKSFRAEYKSNKDLTQAITPSPFEIEFSPERIEIDRAPLKRFKSEIEPKKEKRIINLPNESQEERKLFHASSCKKESPKTLEWNFEDQPFIRKKSIQARKIQRFESSSNS